MTEPVSAIPGAQSPPPRRLSALYHLGERLTAEICRFDNCPHHPPTAAEPGGLALLRARILDGRGMALDELLDRAGRTPRMDVLVGLLFARAASGSYDVTDALRRRLAASGPTDIGASLLDLATEHRLRPVGGVEVLDAFADAPSRRVRHAAIRHLAEHEPNERVDKRLLTWPARHTSLADQLVWVATARSRGIKDADICAALPRWVPALVRDWPGTVPRVRPGLTVVQCALWGSLFRPGVGDSGGLSVFLTALGDSLAQHPRIGTVITLALANEDELAHRDRWATPLSAGHVALTIPNFDRGGWGPDTTEQTHPELSWWLAYLLRAHSLKPDVVHVRFSDDATWAVARTALRLGAGLAYTVAPDPHRTVLERHLAGPGELDEPALQFDLHRMFLADVMVGRADTIIGIAGHASRDELARYFPRLAADAPDSKSVHVIPEGLAPLRSSPNDERDGADLVTELFRPKDGLPFLDRAHAGVTLLFNVGRLNPIKQQDVLVEAWLESGLVDRTVLVLIGGSPDHPTPTERDMADRLRSLIASVPLAAGRIAIMPALGNRQVRLLESAVGRLLPAAGPHVYVCASAKEEFGIAVLEAMDAGLLAIGPRRGGLSHYIRPGKNGFLVDTSTSATLSTDLAAIVGAEHSSAQLRAIARAGQATVRASYYIGQVRDAFADRYLHLVRHRQHSDGPPG
ncbi:MAG: glycosyltransferase family 4 protein [Pseudonocardiales bacterium]|nr:glycosyltransferase family 4 protein [Pseudonocardiales bacterium]